MANHYIDCDGHVMERVDEIAELIGRQNGIEGEINPRRMVPSLDRFHTPRLQRRTPGTFDPSIGPERWMEFLQKTGLEYSVLFPTEGLAYGQISLPSWAAAYARGYNDWLHEKYLRFSPKLKGVALIPMQDVPSAVAELRRAVRELGMLGAMLPSNGLRFHLGAKEYWPIYEEAEKLGCALAVHGGCYGDLGFNSFGIFPATRALGMPFPLAIAATGMIVEGMLDRFPKLRVGFLEGGTAWIPIVIDRLEREMEYGGLQLKRKPEEYFTGGRIFVGCEGNEKALAYAIERVGSEPFMFASDFPHEISLGNCMEEINEILEREDLKQEHKAAILGDNARRFYGI
ncbi:MAG TPA: amidohydrolase family protein [Candidatus Binatia bacterium]|nr:amidohydrolase family protein [Candidatus Binatia bacterium]